MATEITMDNVLPLLRAAVDARGDDYIYQPPDTGIACVYLHDGQPHCLIGVVLDSVGIPLDGLDNSPDDAAIAALAREAGLPIEANAALVLGAAQLKQDNGNTWGEAYDAAARRHADVQRFGR